MDHSLDALRAEYEGDFEKLEILPSHVHLMQVAVIRIRAHRSFYDEVEKRTNVPWYWVGITHLRESNLNFHAWLHNGDPMVNHYGNPVRTVHVPANRPPNPACTWEDGACDALEEMDLVHVIGWTPAYSAWAWEHFNGFGYRDYHHMKSPYLVGGTNLQTPGKYVRDREFDPSVMDEQLGTMGILKLILEGEKEK